MIRNITITLGICLLAPISFTFGAVEIFVTTGSLSGGELYRIDPAAQSVTLIGDSGLSRLGGLDFSPGNVLYGVSGGSIGPAQLYTISTTTAQATLIGTASNNGADGLAFNAAGTLYASAWDGTSGRLWTLNPNTATVLSNIPLSGSGNSAVAGLDFGPGDQLWGSRGNAAFRADDIVRINTATGALSPLPGFTDVISGLWFAQDGTLYAGSPNGNLFTINTVTGQKTLLFNTGILQMSGMAGRDIIPEPATLVLLIAASAVAGMRRPHRP